ncbi:MAG: D-Ala-D-Ala carboxypeptidase family metallohydrolase [Pseudomonadales bacterium]
MSRLWMLLLLGCWELQAQPLPMDVRANGQAIEASITSVFVLPGTAVTIEYLPRRLDETLELTAKHGTVAQLEEHRWLYQPGNAAISDLVLNNNRPNAAAQQMRLRVFRLQPFAPNQQRVGSFRIGQYPPASSGHRGLDYVPPPGLIKADSTLLSEQVSTHFTLGQFVSRQQQSNGAPSYLILTTPLLETLEHLIQTLHSHGWPGQTLTILSGYRTPYHNQAVGGASRSRHIYGDAVDLIPDADGDGQMDDLNKDGRGDREDVEWLIAMLMRRAIPATMGGAGSYETAGTAGAFLHLDTRGLPADWQR